MGYGKRVADNESKALVPGLTTIQGMVSAAQGMNDTAAVHAALAMRQLCKLDEVWAQCTDASGEVDPERLNTLMQAMSKEAKITRQAAEHLERSMALRGNLPVAEDRFARALDEHKG